MNITIISGSHRNPSQSEKIARYIETLFQDQYDDVNAQVISLGDNPIPLWEEAIWNGDESWNERLAPLKQQLNDSDALVVISPEYHGQVPAGLKNFFLMFNRFELGHKPAYIVSVSAGPGGTYPISELRTSSYKNNRLCYIPEHLIVRNVESVFNADDADNDADSDSYYKERLKWGLDILVGYGEALKAMREKVAIHDDRFGNGM